MIQGIEKVAAVIGRMLPPKKVSKVKAEAPADVYQGSQPDLRPLTNFVAQQLPPTPQQIMASKPLGGAAR